MSWQDKIRDPDCEECPLHEEAQYVCLMGSGKRKAKVMLIGEAPGAREDETHQAFVGKAGQFLNELLRDEAGLERSDCYITNAVKCRPPENATPTRGQVKVCSNLYLTAEIQRVQPDLIVPLGNSALQAVLGRSGIKKHRGTKVDFSIIDGRDDVVVLPTYHPAGVLRNPYLDAEIRADFRQVGRIARGESSGVLGTNVRIIRRKAQLDALIKLLLQQEEIAFDLETYTFDNGIRLKGKPVVSGLQEWHDDLSVISCISLAWAEGETAVVPLYHERSPWKDPQAVLRELKPALERRSCRFIAHNGKFDCRWLAANGVFVNLTFDTMLAAHMIDENRSKGLKPLSQVHLGVDAYDIGEDVRDAYHAPLKRLCVYAAKDADYTLRLYHILREQLKQEPRTARIFKLLMMPASAMLTKVERRGIWVDEEKLDEMIELSVKNRDKIKQLMYKHVPKHKRPQPVPKGATKKLAKELSGINFNSPQQVAEWMFRDLKLNPLKKTKSGADSTDESVMLQLGQEHIAAKALLKYRKWEKYLSTYLLPLKHKHRDTKSRAHPTFKLFGTVTGRLSCEEPNIQQIPRDSGIRSLIGAPPGWSFIEADYSQIELRVAAMLANETSMLRAYHEGRDVHMETAVELLKKPADQIEKEERKLAKAVNFGFLYGMGWRKFIEYARDNYEIVVTEKEAKEYREAFFRRWPRLVPWHERQRRLVQRHGRVQSPIGRVRHLSDVYSGDKEVRAEAERQAINSPVQSFASDLMLVSALRLDAVLDPRVAFIVGSVHDALLFQARQVDVLQVAATIYHEMMNPPIKRMFGAELTVPIDVEVQYGQYWGGKDNKLYEAEG